VATVTITINPVNDPPDVGVRDASVIVDEGQTATNLVRAADVDGDAVLVSASTGTLSDNLNGTWNWDFLTGDGPQSQTVTIFADDGQGGMNQTSFGLTVNNVVPSVYAGADVAITSGDTFSVNASFTDPGVGDTHTATVDFGYWPWPQPPRYQGSGQAR
jgi:hypothetical protein